jgi:predicted DNA-binding transcriptional regulator AlpA
MDALRQDQRSDALEPLPLLLNEGQAAALLGIGRRKFSYLRSEPWFAAKCQAIELGPRALRWHRDELIAAIQSAPRVTVRAEPETLADARAKRQAA